DTTAPTVTINQASGQADPTNASPINFTVVFSEPVSGFTASDVTLSGTAGATTATVTGGSTTYNVAVSGMTGDGTVIATVGANGASDAAGNLNLASTSTDNTVTYDTTPPEVTIDLQADSDTGIADDDDITKAASLVFDVDFDEPVSGVTLGDFSLAGTATGCMLDDLSGTGDSYTLTVIDCDEGSVTVTFAADGASDTAGNTGPEADTDGPEVLIDRTAPAATIDLQSGSDTGASSSDNITKANDLVFDVTFDENVFGLNATDFSVGGTASGCLVGAMSGLGDTYTVTLTGCGEGTVILSLSAAGVTDTAGNGNALTSGPTVTVDRTAPAAPSTPDLDAASDSGSSSTDNVTNDQTPTFNGTAEDLSIVTVFDGATPLGTTATDAAGNWSFTSGMLSNGTHSISARATDAAGNQSGPSGSLTVTIDALAPSSAITFPMPGSYDAFQWNAGCSTAFVGDACGTWSDSGLAGVESVAVALRNAAGDYWTGTGNDFSSSTPIWHATTGSTTWNRLIPFSSFPAAGSYTLLSRATDVAGNVQAPPASTTFSVVNPSSPYVFEGFFAPIENPSTLNNAKAGQAIPVKWRLTRDGVPVSDPSSFVALTSRTVYCGSLGTIGIDEIETYTTNSGLQYNGDGKWHFNWKTPKSYAGECRIMTLTLNDGSTHDAYFKFK
ncbi:MAG TPA: Ig-like domain-containing protein, partial [Candidatus Limnocylindria bacterium]|nr:Ig-like domain-containing protein [Candidatus Limnocylindria bacterium]